MHNCHDVPDSVYIQVGGELKSQNHLKMESIVGLPGDTMSKRLKRYGTVLSNGGSSRDYRIMNLTFFLLINVHGVDNDCFNERGWCCVRTSNPGVPRGTGVRFAL